VAQPWQEWAYPSSSHRAHLLCLVSTAFQCKLGASQSL